MNKPTVLAAALVHAAGSQAACPGPELILANIRVDFRDGLKTGEMEQAVAQLDRSIKNRCEVWRHHSRWAPG